MVLRMRDPFATLLEMQQAMENAIRSDWFGTRTNGRGVYPPINAFRSGDEYVVVMELPGVKKDDLDIEVKGNTVRVRGKKTVEIDGEAKAHLRERTEGDFERTLTLPGKIEVAKVTAEYRDGVLTVRLPRAESDKPRSVAIN